MTYLIQSQVTQCSVCINSNVFRINFYAFSVTCDGFVVTVLQKTIKQNGRKPQKLSFAKTSETVAKDRERIQVMIPLAAHISVPVPLSSSFLKWRIGFVCYTLSSVD